VLGSADVGQGPLGAAHCPSCSTQTTAARSSRRSHRPARLTARRAV